MYLNTEKIKSITIHSVVLLPFLLVFSTVFANSETLAIGVVSAKYFWFYFSMGICAIIITIPTILKRKENLRLTLSDILLLILVLLYMFPLLSGTEKINTKFILLTMLFCLYFFIRFTISNDTTGKFKTIIQLFLILTALAQSVWGMLQLYGHLPSEHSLFLLTGSFYNPGPYAGYIAVTLPMAVHFIIKDKYLIKETFHIDSLFQYLRLLLSTSTLVAAILVLPASMSRAAWLASLGGCMYVLSVYTTKFKSHIKTSSKIVLLSILVIAFISALSAGIYFLKKDSADGRVLMWKISLQAIAKNPTGVGLGNFSGAYGCSQVTYMASGNASEQEKNVAGNPEYAFNEFLQIALESGIAGLLLFVAVIVVSVKNGVRQKNLGVTGSLIALLIFASMSYPFSVLPFLLLLAYFLADINSTPANNYPKSHILKPVSINFIRIILIISVGLCLYNRIPTYKAYNDWNNSKILFSMHLYKDVKDDYIRLSPYLSDRVDFLFEYGQVLSKTGDYRISNEVLMKATKISCDPMLYNIIGKNYQALKKYRKAEENYIRAANLVPNRFYPFYLLAKLYYETNDMKQFNRTANIVLQKEPKVYSPAINEMREELINLIEKTKK